MSDRDKKEEKIDVLRQAFAEEDESLRKLSRSLRHMDKKCEQLEKDAKDPANLPIVEDKKAQMAKNLQNIAKHLKESDEFLSKLDGMVDRVEKLIRDAQEEEAKAKEEAKAEKLIDNFSLFWRNVLSPEGRSQTTGLRQRNTLFSQPPADMYALDGDGENNIADSSLSPSSSQLEADEEDDSARCCPAWGCSLS